MGKNIEVLRIVKSVIGYLPYSIEKKPKILLADLEQR